MPNTQLLVKVEHLYSGKKYKGKQTSKERGMGSPRGLQLPTIRVG